MEETTKVASTSSKKLGEMIDSAEGTALVAATDKAREAYRSLRSETIKRHQAGENVWTVVEKELKASSEAYLQASETLKNTSKSCTTRPWCKPKRMPRWVSRS